MARTIVDLVRTMSTFLRFGTVRLKDNSGAIDLRNAADTAYVNMNAKDIRALNTLLTSKLLSSSVSIPADTSLVVAEQIELGSGVNIHLSLGASLETEAIVLEKTSTPTAPSSGEMTFYQDSATLSPAAVDSTLTPTIFSSPYIGDYQLLRIIDIGNTAITLYQPGDDAKVLLVEMIGGGGGGGGATQVSLQSGAGGGGGGGAYASSWITNDVQGLHPIVIGAGGNASAGSSGNTAAATTFSDTAGNVIVKAAGGGGGNVDTSAAAHIGGLAGGGGLTNANQSIGDTLLDGSPGTTGIVIANNQAIAGNGGLGWKTSSGPKGIAATGAGNQITPPSMNWGCGGAGGVSLNGAAAVSGATGYHGGMRIWEFG